MNNLITKIYDLDVGKLRTVPVDLKKLSDVVDNEVVKNTKFYTLKPKVNNVEKTIPDAFLNTKINEVENKIIDHAKYITTQEFNELRAENFEARLK